MSNPNGYEMTFKRFDKVGGQWILTWNWGSFLFGFFWYLYKGLWVKSLIYFLAVVVLGALTGGIALIPLWIAGGLSGNYDMYLFYKKGTHLWESAGVATSQTTSQKRSEALEVAYTQGVINDVDYSKKKAQLDAIHDKEKKIAALEGMYQNNLIDEAEFAQRKQAIYDKP